jgi:hypothetical protein
MLLPSVILDESQYEKHQNPACHQLPVYGQLSGTEPRLQEDVQGFGTGLINSKRWSDVITYPAGKNLRRYDS